MTKSYVSIGSASATDLREVRSNGIMIPLRGTNVPMLILKIEAVYYYIFLSGPNAFIYFPIGPERSHEGLFFPDPEIVIDLSSITTTKGKEHQKGLLILSDTDLFVVATPMGNLNPDPEIVPVRVLDEPRSQAVKLGFSQWAIAIADGDTRHILWERPASSAD